MSELELPLFTLNFPITVPAEHTFFDEGTYPVPPLLGRFAFSCVCNEGHPLVLRISGFSTEQEALEFCGALRHSLHVASLGSGHSIGLPDATPTTSAEKHFDGSIPTVTPTASNALPYHMSASMQTGVHISVLAKGIDSALSGGAAQKAAAKPELAMALQLYADCQFAGERNAQFVVLLTALEILVSSSSSKGKRSAVIALVKNALSKAGHPNPKAAGKALDDLYMVRNSLVHEARPVTQAELKELKETVQLTLKALVA